MAGSKTGPSAKSYDVWGEGGRRKNQKSNERLKTEKGELRVEVEDAWFWQWHVPLILDKSGILTFTERLIIPRANESSRTFNVGDDIYLMRSFVSQEMLEKLRKNHSNIFSSSVISISRSKGVVDA